MAEWTPITISNMYVGYVPMEEVLKDEPLLDFISKLENKSLVLTRIASANGMELEKTSILAIEAEQANVKKKKAIPKVVPNCLEIQRLEEFQPLWEKYVANPGELKSLEFVDARTVEKATKCIVHLSSTPDKVTIFKEHFLACKNAEETWKTFAERKFEKRDTLIGFEKEVQQFWNENKTFEIDFNDSKKEKWFGTFPYPYMNGALHLGHGFTIAKIDFQVAYQRLKGKTALFPFSFHGTGMPIKACADKLKREIADFGCPPKFPKVEVAKVEVEEKSETSILKPQRRANAKTQQKGSVDKYQWEIMESMGIPAEDIPSFQVPEHWLKFFSPRTQTDLTSLGFKIDWRRSFTTTDLNPFYDSFVRWQFTKLKEMGKIKFGKRPTVYSPFDQQPCMDHDRRSGEKLGVSEYTIVKQEVLKPYPACLKQFEDSPFKIYFAPATLRPETMYGQTNCWILPTGEYGAYQISETEVFILTPRAARNLCYQEKTFKEGEVVELATFMGTEILGTKLHAPLGKYPEIYALPMMTISDKKTTGVVTSVPSDSPDDFAALRDLQSKPAMREKFGITEEMCSFAPVPIIFIEGLGNLSAVKVVEDLNIKSQNDKDLLAKAKETCYMKGFYEGEMLVGEFAGQSVQTVKPLVKAFLVEKNLALTYYEPEGEVISRSGDVCVVALCDQWFLNYGDGEPEWKAQAIECLKQMNTYEGSNDTRTFDQMLAQLNVTHQWACSRSFGLGTKIPWDVQYVVESLSDSTIYMAYYTIAQIIQGEGNFMGNKEGPHKIKPEDMTYEVFEYIFSNGPFPTQTNISKEILDKCKGEFNYFYPIDVRVTGKDLLNNHMIFWIYNHVAFFPKEKWPKGLKGNGWLLLNGTKMSKSTGNFVSISDACTIYGADPVRFAFALGGDALDDPNYTIENVETAILSTFTLFEWIKEMFKEKETMRNTSELNYADKIFEAEIKALVSVTDKYYEGYQYQNVLTSGFFEMIRARDEYKKRCQTNKGMNWHVLNLFIRTITITLSPILSHTSEYVWRQILGETGSVFDASWPEFGEWNQSLIDGNIYINKFLASARAQMQKSKAKTTFTVQVAGSHPLYYQKVVNIMKEYYDEHKSLADTGSVKLNQFVISKHGTLTKTEITKVNKAIAQIKAEFTTSGVAAFEVNSSFDEKALIEENSDYIKNQLNVPNLVVVLVEEKEESKGAKATPGKPLMSFQ